MYQYRADYCHNKKDTSKCTYVNFFQKKLVWFTKDANLQNCWERFFNYLEKLSLSLAESIGMYPKKKSMQRLQNYLRNECED